MFDAHCHLTDEAFDDERDEVLARARNVGVRGFVTIGANVQHAEAACALAEAHTDVWCTVGVHPHEASEWPASATRVKELLQLPRVVAIGETGLDYYYDNSPRETQRAAFDWHVALAAEHRVPLVVHTRNAEADTIAVVRAAGASITGVLHCFTGTAALLDAALDVGWYISFAGIVTFKKYDGAGLVRQVPEAQLLIETDSPYLAPVPKRGRRNEPAYLASTCEAVATFRGVTTNSIAQATEQNARQFYRIGAS